MGEFSKADKLQTQEIKLNRNTCNFLSAEGLWSNFLQFATVTLKNCGTLKLNSVKRIVKRKTFTTVQTQEKVYNKLNCLQKIYYNYIATVQKLQNCWTIKLNSYKQIVKWNQ